ncbi:MAG: hypothetical protein JNJ60_02560, partial [Rhodocyclaceae bacterium]|nr:hypothetical protein [Rhodocyclaceae bacterium]
MPQDQQPLSDSTVPQFFVSGREVNELARDVQSLAVEEHGGGMKSLQCELTAVGPEDGARDEQLLYLDGRIVDFGSELKLSMGPRSAAQTVFEGKLSALELAMEQGREPHVRIYAEDKLMDLRLTRRFKTYENVSDADLLQQIASQHGLSAQADAQGPTYKSVQQWNQSDLAFLRARARRLQADLWLDGSTLHMATRDARNGNRITLIQGNDLLAVEIRAELAHQRASVVGGGYDADAKDAIDEEAAASVAAGETSGLRAGAELLQSAFGERAAYRSFDVP